MAHPDDRLTQALLELESTQRSELPAPGALIERETTRVRIPPGGELPQSAAWLERLYAGELVPREKKPMVVDTRRSFGPFMASVDDSPMVLIDACSQIATLTHGFGNRFVMRDLYRGRFGGCLWSNPDTTAGSVAELEEYASALRAVAPAGLDHVAFVAAGGAEANEKALHLARARHPDWHSRRRVLAFEQGFHGRTWVSLGATWNPAKRGPFELPGYEAVFAEPNLASVEAALREHGHEIYAAILEPMMAEGGDVYLTPEFVRGLRAMTRAAKIPLIADEVQTGFATGGPFFWWNRLGLGTSAEPETSPDFLTLAKKAQLGVVLSAVADPNPAEVAVANALRGLIHLEHAGEQRRLGEEISARAQALGRAHASLISGVRSAGTTFAFDFPTPGHTTRFIAQRFCRGLMTYQAGALTIRFRLNASFRRRHLDDLFVRIGQALERIDDPTATTFEPVGHRRKRDPSFQIRAVEAADWPAIEAIEAQAYEPARQTPRHELEQAAEHGVGLVAVDGGEVLGFCFGGPLEDHKDVDGPNGDDTLGRAETLYAVDLTVSEAARGRGVARALKRAQLSWAQEAGYRFLSGRNKVGATDAMVAINRSMGSFEVGRYARQYGGSGTAEYYRIPLVAPPPPEASNRGHELDLASGIQQPFGAAPGFMGTRELTGPLSSKLNLSNYATIDSIHYMEHLRQILPRGTGHIYITSSRDEMIDKCLRCLRVTRPNATHAVSVARGYYGHVTAAARSLTDPAGFAEPFALFDWPRLPHPATVSPDELERAFAELLATREPDTLFAVFVEAVGERSGLCFEGQGARTLARLCRASGVPLVLVETASGGYRNGQSAFATDSLPEDVQPDAVLWYPGGQLGHLFVSDELYVAKPLTLISTWDGDEVCMIRTHEHLRAAHKLDLAPLVAAADALVAGLAEAFDLEAGGAGLYRTLAGSHAGVAALDAAAGAAGVLLRPASPGVRAFVPALDLDPAVLSRAHKRILAEHAAEGEQ